MTISDDTICAISTPAGIGGIAVVRISGPKAIAIANEIWKGKNLLNRPSHTATFGRIEDGGSILDEGVATVFRAPHSFTGEDVVELSVHGSVWVQNELINLLIRKGCRMAQAGEFTRRAFASGKMDLAEAEAVADVIASTSKASHRMAIAQMKGTFSARLNELREKLLELASLLELELDFSEEDVEFADREKLMSLSEETLEEVNRLASSFATGDAIRRGVPVAIIGEPNVGKSSILNRLIDDERAIVSDIPGTTRDTIEDTTDIDGITFRFIDTAGLRDTADSIEALGIERAWSKIASARIVLWVVTPSSDYNAAIAFAQELSTRRANDAKTILVLNKTDLLDSSHIPHAASTLHSAHIPDMTNAIHLHLDQIATAGACNATVRLSAGTGAGMTELRATLTRLATEGITGGFDAPDAVIVTNARHYEALTNASHSLQRAIEGLSTQLPADLVAQDIRETLHHLASITGTITTPDILASIFSRFCIGK